MLGAFKMSNDGPGERTGLNKARISFGEERLLERVRKEALTAFLLSV